LDDLRTYAKPANDDPVSAPARAEADIDIRAKRAFDHRGAVARGDGALLNGKARFARLGKRRRLRP
jgi:hypothetical protein